MIDVDMKWLVPAFIRADSNGYALTAALEKGMSLFCDVTKNGLGMVNDVDAMPEWRLDERAWELGILYDVTADIEIKRNLVKNAVQRSAKLGTPAALIEYLSALYNNIQVQESWEYGGEPYHFRLLVDGKIDTDILNKTHKAIDAVKNVRSVLDGISATSESVISIEETVKYMPYSVTMAGEALCGTVPYNVI